MSNYKKMAMLMCSIGLFLLLTGITYSFFNYTRTGSLNNLGTGRINFNSEQNGTLNITNAFPIKSEELNIDNLDEITIEIEGDTTYSEGEEFEVKIVEVSNVVSGKRLPITYIATYEAKENKTIGLPSEDYWNEREAKDSNIYLLNETGEVRGNQQILVGYIKNDNEGINGILTIKAYVNGDKIAISDTYGGSEYTVNSNMSSEALSYCLEYFGLDSTGESFCRGESSMHGISLQEGIDLGYSSPADLEDLTTHGVLIKHNYTNDTTYEWVNDRVVFTTEEWNSFTASGTPISFKIRVESNEGIWASIEETPSSCFRYDINPIYVRNENMNVSTCVSILTNEGFDNDLLEGETLEAFCNGTGTLSGNDFDNHIKINTFNFIVEQLEENEIIDITGNTASIYDYDESCGEDVVIPRKIQFAKKEFSINQDMNINDCVSIFTNMGYDNYLQTGETMENFCNGTGTIGDYSFQYYLNNNLFYPDELSTLVDNNIILERTTEEGEAPVVKIYGSRDYPGLSTKKLKTVVIPNTVKEIGYGAFASNHLTSINIPNSVTIIGTHAFSGNQITNLTIPNTVTKIGNSAFSSNQITSVNISDGITEIGDYAFTFNNISSFVFPSTLTTIGVDIFESNSNLNTITINMNSFGGTGASNICSESFAKKVGIDNLTNVTLGNNVQTIGFCAFYNDGLENIVIPNSVTTIGQRAFSSNQLSNITIPNSVTTIEDYAFYENELTSVVIPSSISKIPTCAFSSNQLSNVVIPSGVVTIGSQAFSGNQLTNVVIPSGVVTISSQAFYDNQLTSVTLPDTVTSVGSKAFANNNITSLTIGSGIKNFSSIPSDSFDWYNLQYLDKVIINLSLFQGRNFNTLTLGPNVTEINQNAFSRANINSITIPATVSTIGLNAFSKSSDSSIGSIIINKTCSNIKAMANYPWIGTNYRAGTTIYGLNNEICDSW